MNSRVLKLLRARAGIQGTWFANPHFVFCEHSLKLWNRIFNNFHEVTLFQVILVEDLGVLPEELGSSECTSYRENFPLARKPCGLGVGEACHQGVCSPLSGAKMKPPLLHVSPSPLPAQPFPLQGIRGRYLGNDESWDMFALEHIFCACVCVSRFVDLVSLPTRKQKLI